MKRFDCFRRLIPLLALWALTCVSVVQSAEQPLEFRVTFDPAVSDLPFTGRVYVMIARRERPEPRFGPNWFSPDPFFARDVQSWRPGDGIVVDNKALGYPGPLAMLPKGTYSIQAVMDFGRQRDFSDAEGNGFSHVVRIELDPDATGPVELKIDQVVPPHPFRETERVKLVDIESPLVSNFYCRPIHLRAGVILPASFQDKPEKRYPVIYDIPGFSGNHFAALSQARSGVTDVAGEEMLYVVLDPDCPLGHHVFADSDNNGPYGQALVEELIPHIEQKFRGIGKSSARFVTGHSSGGWSSLWLQITYPDFFGGVWSTSPDPVDFRDFQRINIYAAGTNMFADDAGQPRPIARRGDRPFLFYKPFSDMETVMGHGGQLASFEAVFSRRGPDGKPAKLWNRRTGEIDLEVAKRWERYDIRLVLERNWKTLGPKLTGKLHVYTGSMDSFYLEGAVALLKDSLERLGSDAVVEIVAGKDHGTLRDKEMRERIAREMTQSFRLKHPEE